MKPERNKMTEEIRDTLESIAEDQRDELWENATDHGIWVRTEDLPDVDSEELASSGLIEDEARCEALENGGKPTPAEKKQFHKWWAESQLEGSADADFIPGYVLADIKDQEGNEGVALVLRKGYSFSELRTWIEGVFDSQHEAIQYLKKGGFHS